MTRPVLVRSLVSVTSCAPSCFVAGRSSAPISRAWSRIGQTHRSIAPITDQARLIGAEDRPATKHEGAQDVTETSERTRTGRVIGVALVVVLALGVIALRSAGDSHATGPRGLVTNEDAAFAGYTLYSPLELQRALLVDMEGNVVHDWETTTQPGLFQYLLEDGHLLRAGDLEQEGAFAAGQGAGGRIEELDWDGNVVWQLDYADDNVMQHHDIEPLPNGNVLFVAWERKSGAEAIAAGRDPELLPDDELWPDTIVVGEQLGVAPGGDGFGSGLALPGHE